MPSTTHPYAVIGWPLGYSLSPILHNDFFKQEGIDATYTSVPLTLDELGPWVKAKACSGFNVTVPHKENILPFLDELSDSATAIGAINTVKNVNGRLHATNTDSPGFTMMLKEDLSLSMKGLNVLLLGAGGASRAIVYAAGLEEAKCIYVFDTDTVKSEALKSHFASLPIELCSPLGGFKGFLPLVDLVINATPVGMEATVDISILSADDLAQLKPTTPVVDIIYVPAETKLLRLARERGLPTCNGLGMLAGQGILAEEFWFGKRLGYHEAKDILSKNV